VPLASLPFSYDAQAWARASRSSDVRRYFQAAVADLEVPPYVAARPPARLAAASALLCGPAPPCTGCCRPTRPGVALEVTALHAQRRHHA
jgi:hypothetical protein